MHGLPNALLTKMLCPQTMYRIKDPKRSLDFYTRIIGFRWVLNTMSNQLKHCTPASVRVSTHKQFVCQHGLGLMAYSSLYPSKCMHKVCVHTAGSLKSWTSQTASLVCTSWATMMQVKFQKKGKKGYAQHNRIQILKIWANAGNNILSSAAMRPQKGSD